jgi:hypothetical protein
VFGCPVYVLDAALQDGHKIPKWVPRACLCVFLGFSSLHSSQVPLVMNVESGKIFPQFHVIFDDKFETVLSLTPEESIGDQWKSILHLTRESFADVDVDENGNDISSFMLMISSFMVIMSTTSMILLTTEREQQKDISGWIFMRW